MVLSAKFLDSLVASILNVYPETNIFLPDIENNYLTYPLEGVCFKWRLGKMIELLLVLVFCPAALSPAYYEYQHQQAQVRDVPLYNQRLGY